MVNNKNIYNILIMSKLVQNNDKFPQKIILNLTQVKFIKMKNIQNHSALLTGII
jgi:hypothetical protein